MFKGELHRDKSVPLALPIKNILKYIQVEGPLTLQVMSVRVNNKWFEILDQERTLLELTKGVVIQELLRLCFLIDLEVEIITPLGNRTASFQINSSQPIEEIKNKFQEDCKFEAKLQKWVIHEKELEG